MDHLGRDCTTKAVQQYLLSRCTLHLCCQNPLDAEFVQCADDAVRVNCELDKTEKQRLLSSVRRLTHVHPLNITSPQMGTSHI